jgi:gluconate 2-dehydrogenase alpha chain
MTIQNWPVTYDELEPFHDRFEKLCGVSGKAGNLRGNIVGGGNPCEGPRSAERRSRPAAVP